MSSGGLRLGIDLGGTKIEIIALARGGGELLRRRVATPHENYGAILQGVAGLVRRGGPGDARPCWWPF